MNSNLLQITTIPISIEIKVTNAKYQYPEGKDRQPKVNITNTQGGYVMKADPIKVKIDTYEAKKEPWLRSYDGRGHDEQKSAGWIFTCVPGHGKSRV